MKNILVIAPHADDEILGCGGSINFYQKKGFNIYVAIMTNANRGNDKRYPIRFIENLRNEAIKSHNFLKITKTFFFDFAAPKLDQEPISIISDQISNIIKKIKPQKTFIPHIGDSHVDHQIIHKAALVALRPLYKNYHSDILSYETLSETEWGIKNNNSVFVPNHYVKLSKKDIDNKIKAFNFYKTQIKKYPHPRSKENILNLAKYRGSNISEKFAEAFNVIRTIE